MQFEDEGWQQTTPRLRPGSTIPAGLRLLDARELKRVIKNVETLPYYHYRLHRSDVEAMIPDDGEFILRRGTRNDPEGFTVSARWKGRVMHFPVHWVGNKCCFEGDAFTMLQNLVHYHVNTGIPVTRKSGCLLIKAKSRQNWELLEKELELGKKLGSGAFGAVYQAKWIQKGTGGAHVIVAVKTLDLFAQDTSGVKMEHARNEMLREARIMRELSGHTNLIREHGVTIDRDQPYAVMEFMNGGTLLERLRTDPKLSLKSKVRVLLEVARGLSYMNRSGYIHRDVSARNCLFNLPASPEDEVGMAKITDFGLARKLGEKKFYKAPESESFPVKWTAPEGLIERVWWTTSDVWGIGVLVWEVFSDGAQPYCDEEKSDDAQFLLEFLRAGKRMSPPEGTPPGVEALMSECWSGPPLMRPPMWYVCWKLQDELILLIK